MQLWKLCFPHDTQRFIRFYFERVYVGEQTLVLLKGGRPVAALQMIPYRLKMWSSLARAHEGSLEGSSGSSLVWGGYISGAMTHPGHRRKGYMAQLLEAAFGRMRERGYAFSFLIPQGERLIDYYGRFGFERAFAQHTACYNCLTTGAVPDGNIKVHAALSPVDLPALYAVYSAYLMKKSSAVLKSEQQFSNILWDFFDEGGILFAGDGGLAFTYKKRNKVVVTEFFYRDTAARTEFLQAAGAYYSAAEVVVVDDPAAPVSGFKGMIRPLAAPLAPLAPLAPPTDIYMGPMLE